MSPEILSQNAEKAFAAVVKAVAAGNCNLFLGAAVHAPPSPDSPYQYSNAERPPIGAGLAKILGAESGYAQRYSWDQTWNLQKISQDYEKEMAGGRDALVRAVRREVEQGKKPSAALRALAELDFPVVITANYDTLFQKALGLVAKTPFVSWYESNDPDQGVQMPARTRDRRWDDPATAQNPTLYKIHGDIDTSTSLVITEEDYIQFLLRMGDKPPLSPVPGTVLQALKSAPTLFIGYSLNDFNMRLLLKALRQAAQDRNDFPPLYSVDMKPDPLIWWWWYNKRGYVNFVAWDVWDFVPKLYSQVKGTPMRP